MKNSSYQENTNRSKNNEEKRVKEISQLKEQIKKLKIDIEGYQKDKLQNHRQIKTL